ncbi:caspase family protein [Microscilla marina]|uniref:Uncharacterized protein n=1 Tax=Microscilla marina ATCC 23134 TaxID=313606 RepID=A1ZV47_MICM2|nr:caspase family protein [Microscilla marina]EAY25703.1 hypothetical protein M23134_04877 [Microscilla marina ATCC 23134]
MMKNTDAYEQTGYFSEAIILDYIDGKLSAKDQALFEQQMQQDGDFQLAVNGIRGFYLKEHKDRLYLEGLFQESENAIKGAIEHSQTISAKISHRKKQSLWGVAVAAAVALFMIVSLPRLFDKVQHAQNTHAGTDQSLKQQSTENPAAHPMPKTVHRKKTLLKEATAQTATITPDQHVVNKRKKPTAVIKPNTRQMLASGSPVNTTTALADKPGNKTKVALQGKPGTEEIHISSNTRGKNSKKTARKHKDSHDYSLKRQTNYNEGESNFAGVYRKPGKLHLWVFADQEQTTYQQLIAVGNQIAQATGLHLALKKAPTGQFYTMQWQQWLQQAKPGFDDVVWVHYLGTTNQATKRDNQSLASVQVLTNRLNNTLENTKADFKIVMIDQGKPSRQAQKYNVAVGNHLNAPAVVGNTQGYRQLFLGNSGIITLYSRQPGRNAYQGVLTQALLKSLQNELLLHKKKVHWKTIVKKTAKEVKKQSRKLGRVQKIMKAKEQVKVRY